MSQAPRNPSAIATKLREGRFLHAVGIGGHSMIADEPGSYGGLDAGPSPYDLLSAGLAACTSMTLHLFAEARKIALPPFRVEVRHEKVHAEDCVGCVEGSSRKIDRFLRRIVFDGPVDMATEHLLLKIADKCPVDLTLKGAARVVTSLHAGRQEQSSMGGAAQVPCHG